MPPSDGETADTPAGADAEASLSAERIFAENLRALRLQRGLSQEAIADQMAGLGFRWRQPTVYKVENGARQVQLSEAKALSLILGVTLDQLTESQQIGSEVARFREAVGRLEDRRMRMVEAVFEYEGDRFALQEVLEALSPEVEEALSAEELTRARDAAGGSASAVVEHVGQAVMKSKREK